MVDHNQSLDDAIKADYGSFQVVLGILQKYYPVTNPEPSQSVAEIMYKAGRASVVEDLATILARVEKELLSDQLSTGN